VAVAARQLALFEASLDGRAQRFAREVARFDAFGSRGQATWTTLPDARPVPTHVNEFWTARQRQAHSLHEISYRACFKPQLPAFFIDRLTEPGDVVYDPFMGRGTTVLEAALRGRTPWGNDLNPLCGRLLRPRLEPPTLDQVEARLGEIDFARVAEAPDDLLVFFHPETLQELSALRAYLLDREAAGELDAVDRWIQMVAVNRLTGHSSGFFSVYTLPPNQAVTVAAQRAINAKRQQVPPRREVAPRILRKSRSLLKALTADERARLAQAASALRLVEEPASATASLPADAVDLVVTSPPFLDVVDYATDNWLRCWFCGLDAAEVPLTLPSGLDAWRRVMTDVFGELVRVLRPGGHVAFEVGEVRGGKVRLEEAVIPCGVTAGLVPVLIMINQQAFTKTANCWGVTNQRKGTNTNRICVFAKPA
jgi:hypothetical protein